MSDGENSQQINLGTILDAGFIPEGVKVRVNFDRLGLQVTLSGGGQAVAASTRQVTSMEPRWKS